MELTKLNPIVRSAVMYERINRTDECVAYDARLMYMVSGDITVGAGGGKPFHLTSGELLYIPAGVPYKLKGKYLRMATVAFDLTDEWGYECDSPALTSGFMPEKCHKSESNEPFDKVIKLSGIESEREVFEHMCDTFISAEGAYLAEMSARLKLVLLRVAETADENALPARMVEALGSYIRENVTDEISNTEIGAIFGYHPFYVSKVLKNSKGQTLRQYIISYRLKLAKRLLEATGKSISEIAEVCGFSDASYFTKTFRTSFGQTPKDYRNRFKEDFI